MGVYLRNLSGRVVDVDESRVEYLLRAGFTRYEAPVDEQPLMLDPDDMTVAELRELAAERGIDLAGLRLKPEIVEAVKAEL